MATANAGGSRCDPTRLACRDGREHGGQREAHHLNCADVIELL
jgi:hypothetical protein